MPEFPDRVTLVFHTCGARIEVPSGWCHRCETTPPDEEYHRVSYVREEASDGQARLDARLRATNLGAMRAARGIATVALNDDGQLTEYRPDGTSLRL